ncbi:MAG TPA: hypothetical protein PKD86_04690 [Gemmatales bacterium]|nr:hypothetical protein [Gemmatales bacterium]HMP58630.1 hypothetical protein [Gemmatales bacterium]
MSLILHESVYYDPPRKHVLLLSCMDQRLLDNVVKFMDQLNLRNRYDHLIFAGAAMGARLGTSGGSPWKLVFFDHLNAAINKLKREIKDIFLLEHLDCGAYKKLHPVEKIRKAYDACTHVADQKKFHRREVLEFAREVRDYCRKQQRAAEALAKKAGKPEAKFDPDAWKGIRVRSFVMDLLGNVEQY